MTQPPPPPPRLQPGDRTFLDPAFTARRPSYFRTAPVIPDPPPLVLPEEAPQEAPQEAVREETPVLAPEPPRRTGSGLLSLEKGSTEAQVKLQPHSELVVQEEDVLLVPSNPDLRFRVLRIVPSTGACVLDRGLDYPASDLPVVWMR